MKVAHICGYNGLCSTRNSQFKHMIVAFIGKIGSPLYKLTNHTVGCALLPIIEPCWPGAFDLSRLTWLKAESSMTSGQLPAARTG